MAGSSYLSSPDEQSPYYPDRYIRPLPRRTIRSRLSVETAESISYPPNPPSASLPAYSHYGEEEEFHQNEGAKRLTISQDYDHEHDSLRHDHDHDHDHEHDHDHDHEHDPRDCPYRDHIHEPCPLHHDHDHDHGDTEDEEQEDDDEDDLDSLDEVSPIARRQANMTTRTSPRSPRSQRHGRYNSYGGKASAAADGYEAFENTNNKKKRKIPTSGSMSVQQNLTSEFSQMGIGSRDHSTDPLSLSDSPTGMGVGGAGRGRSTGRRSSARNSIPPIGPISANKRAGPSKHDVMPPATPNGKELIFDEDSHLDYAGERSKEDQGIISKAIANATTLLRNPLKSQEPSGGVLDQQARTPTNSQFTFTCDGDAKGVKFPEQSLYSPDYAHRVNSAPAAAPSQTQKYTNPPATRAPPPQPAPPEQPRRRRRKGDVYTLAARQRKLQQEYTNLQHPPRHEDIWICEFCEYESIFGSPPRALVRQYEIKDRRERKRLAEKRRLLEKAKLKGRKGKKQTKKAAPAPAQNYDDQPLDQMDDYLDEGYDDDPVPMPPQKIPGSYERAGVGRSVSDPAAVDRGGSGGGAVR